MLDPNTVLFQTWMELMLNGDMVGQYRPFGRVTFQDLDLGATFSSRPGPWRHIITTSNPALATELQVNNISINRSIGQDAATCSLDMDNVRQGQYVWEGVDEDPFGVGALSFDRGAKGVAVTSVFGGEDEYPTEWGYSPNVHAKLLTPNIIVRTYQGYGSDNLDANGYPFMPDDVGYLHPDNDTQLVLTGTWLIDRVTLSGGMEDPKIQVELRDMAKLLIEQPVYPPAIPMDRFPLIYCPVPEDREENSSVRKIGKNVARYHSCSAAQHARYGSSGAISGHRGQDAFDGKPGSYWLGHSYTSSRAAWSFEYIQAKCGKNSVNEVYVHTKKYGYVVYVSVYENGSWQGSKTIPYSSAGEDHDHNSNIKYVKRVSIGASCKAKIRLPQAYKAEYVRLTFTNLQYFDEGPYYRYKVAVRDIRAYHTRVKNKTTTIKAQIKPGDIEDWSHAVKELVSWAGFTWVDAPDADPLLGTSRTGEPLRAWGDFENLGAGPIVCTPGDYFLNKSFAEAVRQIADFIGAIFYVDHTGGAQFRLPNVLDSGNFVCDPDSVNRAARIDTHPIELHENVNLQSYSLTFDDTAARSEILVIGKEPDVMGKNEVSGGYVMTGDTRMGFGELLHGQLRPSIIPGDATKGFSTIEECQRMAEMVAVRILWATRKGSAKIIAHPGLQIDDQVRIFERVTNENNIHYVSGIKSDMDLAAGTYTMDLTTHWLGRDPETDWFLDRMQMTPMMSQLPAVLDRIQKSAASSGWEVK